MTAEPGLARALDRYLEEASYAQRRRALARLEREGEHDVADVFDVQATIVVRELRALRSLFTEAIRRRDWEPIVERAERETKALLGAALRRAIARALRVGLRAAAVELQVTPAFGLRSSSAVGYLRQHAAARITDINKTTRDRVATLMAKSAREGWSYGETARQLRTLYSGFSAPVPGKDIRSRAALIAVTETGDAYEEGQLSLGRDLERRGLAIEKSWLDVEDEREEAIPCRRNGDQGWIPLEQAFSSGHMRPLAHVRCRCALQLRRRPGKSVAPIVPGPRPWWQFTSVDEFDAAYPGFLDAYGARRRAAEFELRRTLSFMRQSRPIGQVFDMSLLPEDLRAVRYFVYENLDWVRRANGISNFRLSPPPGFPELEMPPLLGLAGPTFREIAGSDRTFTVAHELGHILAGIRGKLRGPALATERQHQETLANVLAEKMLGRLRNAAPARPLAGRGTVYGDEAHLVTKDIEQAADELLPGRPIPALTPAEEAAAKAKAGALIHICDDGAVVIF